MSRSTASRWATSRLFLRQMEIGFDVARRCASSFSSAVHARFGRLALLQNALGLLLVLPEIGLRGLGFEFGEQLRGGGERQR